MTTFTLAAFALLAFLVRYGARRQRFADAGDAGIAVRPRQIGGLGFGVLAGRLPRVVPFFRFFGHRLVPAEHIVQVNWSRQTWRRLAIGVWLASTIVVWNFVFDRGVESAEQQYLQQVSGAAGRERAAPIRAVMDPAVHRAAITASEWAALPLVGGLVLVLILHRRTRHPGGAGQPLRAP